MNLGAVILAGGASRRMGQDKAWLEMGGQPLIRRALSTVRDSGIQEVLISGHAGTDYSTLGCPVLFDLEPGCGPLGGIERALAVATAPLCWFWRWTCQASPPPFSVNSRRIATR